MRAAPHLRLATTADLAGLRTLMAQAIAELQRDVLSPAEIEASRSVMGLDTTLITDGTYWLAELDGTLAGCGGWSRRATLYGGDHSTALRDPALLDPARDAARIRAMYTAPTFVRRGIGRAILARCEQEAARAGFRRAEMMATLAGVPLYRAAGYTPLEQVRSAPVEGVSVPLVRMGKALEPDRES